MAAIIRPKLPEFTGRKLTNSRYGLNVLNVLSFLSQKEEPWRDMQFFPYISQEELS
jgi:hypothetical protein